MIRLFYRNSLKLSNYSINGLNWTKILNIQQKFRYLSQNNNNFERKISIRNDIEREITNSENSKNILEFSNMTEIKLNLTTIYFESCNFSLNGFKELCEILSICHNSFEEITFKSSNFFEDDASNLREFLKNCKKLKKFTLENNNELGKGFKEICKGLSHSIKTLEKIKLLDQNNHINQVDNLQDILGELFIRKMMKKFSLLE